jgi:hypothetical protein
METLGYVRVTRGTTFPAQCNLTAKRYVAYNGLIVKPSDAFMHKSISVYGFWEGFES